MNRILICLVLFLFVNVALHAGEMRRWTGTNGKVIVAEFLGLEGDIVKIKVKTGREMNVLLSNFGEKDQEIIKKLGAGENPFVEDRSTADRTEESQAKGPEVIRTIIEIDEQGNGKFRLEKTSELPGDDFEGKAITMPLLPKTPIKVKPDGMAKIVFDYGSADEPHLFTGWRYAIDPNAKELKLSVTEGKGDPNTPCLFGLPHGAVKLPMKVLVDTKTFQRDVVDMEWLFCDDKDYLSVVSCKVFCNANNTFEFECAWANRKKSRGDTKTMHEIVRKRGIKIDQPFETSFKVTIPKSDLPWPVRFGFGRHLNARLDQKTDTNTVGHKRIELTAPLFINLGFHVEDYGNKLIFIRDAGYASSQFGMKLGLREHDELRTINAESVESAEKANNLLNPIRFRDNFAFEVTRQGSTKIIRVFK